MNIFLLTGIVLLNSLIDDDLSADFFASNTSICSGSSVTFTDNSSGTSGSTDYTWTFGSGASPATATGRGPHIVVYNVPGTSTVSLTLKDDETDTRTKRDYITVIRIPDAPIVTVTDNCDTTSTLSTNASGILLWSTMEMSSAIVVTTPGVYTVTTTIGGCTSLPESGTAAPRISPGYPVESVDCSLGITRAVVSVLTPVGEDLEYRLDSGPYQDSPSFSRVSNGSHKITVRNSSGCTTAGNFFEVSCGCSETASVTLSSISGMTCGTTPVTVNGNTFGGSAEWVTITENGSGSVSPAISFTTPFSFTYTPKKDDAGRTILITVTTNNPPGTACVTTKETYSLKVNAIPDAPETETVLQPTCTVQPASIMLKGLPSEGTWLLTGSPDGISTSGNGTRTTILKTIAGTYNFTVTSEAGCISKSSADIVILSQPPTPAPPAIGQITPPSCTLKTGSVVLNGLPSTGTWTVTRYPEMEKTSGTGGSKIIQGLPAGVYYFTITNEPGCTSAFSANVVIPVPPSTPSTPVAGTITPPTCFLSTGSVILSGLPATGPWTLIRNPGGILKTGTGANTVISALPPGSYSFSVTNELGCNSLFSSQVVIPLQPGNPSVLITNPAAVCSPARIDLTADAITAGSTPALVYTYWTDATATIPFVTPAAAGEGVYYIKGTALSECYDVKPVTVTVFQLPEANAGPDQFLEYQFTAALDAEPVIYPETAFWSVISGSGEFADTTDPKTTISDLSPGKNEILWTVTRDRCPPSSDIVVITVNELKMRTLITPNMDGKNDYFVVKGLEALGRTELVIFDRRGVQVFKNENYDNLWNGIDYNENPLQEDTYFYVIRSESGKSINGFIVIRR